MKNQKCIYGIISIIISGVLACGIWSVIASNFLYADIEAVLTPSLASIISTMALASVLFTIEYYRYQKIDESDKNEYVRIKRDKGKVIGEIMIVFIIGYFSFLLTAWFYQYINDFRVLIFGIIPFALISGAFGLGMFKFRSNL